MGKTILRIDCVDQRLFVAYDPLIASGGVNEDIIKFNFCPLWDGFGKTAVFYRNLSEVYHAAVSGDECPIPAEVLTEKGEFYFGVFGSKGDATRTTEVIKYSVAQGAMIPGTAPAAPTPDIYAQIMSAVGAIEAKMTPEGIGAAEALLGDYTIPKAAQRTAPNDLLNVNIGVDFSAEPMKPSWFGTDDPAALKNSPVTNSPFYGLRVVYKAAHHTVVELHETWPVQGRKWTRVYDAAFGSWFPADGWAASSLVGHTHSAAEIGAPTVDDFNALSQSANAFGVGVTYIPNCPNNDFNTLVGQQIVKGQKGSCANYPDGLTGGEWAFVINLSYNASNTFGVQLAIDMNGNGLAQRYKRNGEWSAWKCATFA